VAIILKPENLARFVFFIRSEKVMLDSDLARLYGVEARALNQAVDGTVSVDSTICCAGPTSINAIPT
jgi:DNA-binding transcriptional regulator YdaS (Cro superfamily)